MNAYYTEKLAAERLMRCYEIAPPRIRQYLEAEIEFCLSKITPADTVLELGCGYGRMLQRLIDKAQTVIGIDTSLSSLQLARKLLRNASALHLFCMNAIALGVADQTCDVVLCIQNGVSAFHVEQRVLLQEAVRVVRPGGKVLFSSYSEKFWTYRLEWFRLQAAHGLIGEIDEEATGNGVIVGKDGFHATTVSPEDFRTLAADAGFPATIVEVDHSSVLCEIQV
ncbi:hypothetical protein U27_00253 [Candidatus Vecturithrix granuli]|uniref:Methyltransferase domain-containing protein n=1 Tax=Vecturithrix granuli TaxID=1499967 RepID=A0A081C707_VECG1|nr:hypothetical protein U27_00253 [Candidatus Vecturithrix granuli]